MTMGLGQKSCFGPYRYSSTSRLPVWFGGAAVTSSGYEPLIQIAGSWCEDRVLYRPVSGEDGFEGRNDLDSIRMQTSPRENVY